MKVDKNITKTMKITKNLSENRKIDTIALIKNTSADKKRKLNTNKNTVHKNKF
jgi:hypothetical protein